VPNKPLTVESASDGTPVKPATAIPPQSVEMVFGSLKHKRNAKTLEEIDAAVAAEATRRARN